MRVSVKKQEALLKGGGGCQNVTMRTVSASRLKAAQGGAVACGHWTRTKGLLLLHSGSSVLLLWTRAAHQSCGGSVLDWYWLVSHRLEAACDWGRRS